MTRQKLKSSTLLAVLIAAVLAMLLLAACNSSPFTGLPSGGANDGDLTLGQANPGHPRDNTPKVLEAAEPGTQVASSDKAVLDYSNAASGYITAESKTDGKFKVLVNAPDSSQYQYTIENPNTYITMPLSCGDGAYAVGVYQNISGDSYATLFKATVNVTLDDPNLPFLYPNQYVDFANGDDAVSLSQQVTEQATSEIEAIDAIYMWCVTNISFDYNKANTVQPGYLPVNADTIDSKTGICFDYAVLCCSMLRAQGMPAKLEIGYCGTAYHAWLTVYSTENGIIRKEISFRADDWTQLDPTFDSASKGKGDISKIIGDGTNYKPMFYY